MTCTQCSLFTESVHMAELSQLCSICCVAVEHDNPAARCSVWCHWFDAVRLPASLVIPQCSQVDVG